MSKFTTEEKTEPAVCSCSAEQFLWKNCSKFGPQILLPNHWLAMKSLLLTLNQLQYLSYVSATFVYDEFDTMGQSITFARIFQNYFKNFDSFVQIFEHRQKTQSFTHCGKFLKTKNEKSSSNLIDVSHWCFYIYIAQKQYFQQFNGQKQPPEVFCKKRYF